MISDITRKKITLAALIAVLSILASMFAIFLQTGGRVEIVALLVLGLNIILNGALIWLGTSLLFFHKEETTGIISMEEAVNIEQVEKKKDKWKHPLFQSSILLMTGGSISIPIQVFTGLIFLEVFTFSNNNLIVNMISLLPAILFLVGFVLLKRELDIYAAKRRNIISKGSKCKNSYIPSRKV